MFGVAQVGWRLQVSGCCSFGLIDRGSWDTFSLVDENFPLFAASIFNMSKRTRLACLICCPSPPIAIIRRKGRTSPSYPSLTGAYPAWLISLGHLHLTSTRVAETLGGWLGCVTYGISIDQSWILALSTSWPPLLTSKCTPRL